ncbi:UDP-glucose/GDP-mannose dehydrogenase family protein [candidate division KSB1 bacterium]|nr:UDP-glucose/GDP-mannose dehydrogenase family protein [candidate division KSB1 bacterium]
MNICMVGTGYVGLVTGACFAEFGNLVICVDIDKEKIDKLNHGVIPIYESGLEELVSKNVKANRLKFTTDLRTAVEESKVIFIAVGTPANADGSADLSQLYAVARDVGRWMNEYKVVVNKSTVTVGTAKKVKEIIKKNQGKPIDFDIVSNPEFLREGSSINDFMRPDRVVIGADSEKAIQVMKELYHPLYLIETPFVIGNLETAELIKYASNTFLATKISFINEIALLCERFGADVHLVAKAMGLDGRISPKFLHPGPGFGGSCFPKDVSALSHIAKEVNLQLKITEAVLGVNRRQKDMAVEKIVSFLNGVRGKTIGILGLSFKPNTDDVRDAPSIYIIQKLLEKGAKIKAYDPVAVEAAKKVLGGITYTTDAYGVVQGADALVLVTEWNPFRSLDLDRIKSLLKEPNIIDLRNIYEPEKLRRMGFRYTGMGR